MEAKFKYQRQVEPFSPKGPLAFIAIDIIGPLPRTKPGNQVLVIITDCYNKRTRLILTPNLLSTDITHIFLNHWVVPYGIPDIILSDHSQ